MVSRQGSLKVNFTLVYTDTGDAGIQFAEVLYNLATNESLTLLNQKVYPDALAVGNRAGKDEY